MRDNDDRTSAAAVPDASRYRGYADLAAAQVRGRDYEIEVHRRPHSRVAILAPHGGGIEDGTSELARAVAGDDFNLYLFEGRRAAQNYRALHLTSHRFDEPACLALVAECEYVVAIHGCRGAAPEILLGGRDHVLRDRVAAQLRTLELAVHTAGHPFPALHADNVCNRGASGRGVQIELTQSVRRSSHAVSVARAIRGVLLAVGVPHETRGTPPRSQR